MTSEMPVETVYRDEKFIHRAIDEKGRVVAEKVSTVAAAPKASKPKSKK